MWVGGRFEEFTRQTKWVSVHQLGDGKADVLFDSCVITQHDDGQIPCPLAVDKVSVQSSFHLSVKICSQAVSCGVIRGRASGMSPESSTYVWSQGRSELCTAIRRERGWAPETGDYVFKEDFGTGSS